MLDIDMLENVCMSILAAQDTGIEPTATTPYMCIVVEVVVERGHVVIATCLSSNLGPKP